MITMIMLSCKYSIPLETQYSGQQKIAQCARKSLRHLLVRFELLITPSLFVVVLD